MIAGHTFNSKTLGFLFRQKVHVVLHWAHNDRQLLNERETFREQQIMMYRVVVDDVYISWGSFRALLDVPEKRGHDYFIEGVVQIEVVVFVVSVIQSSVALKDSDCHLRNLRRIAKLFCAIATSSPEYSRPSTSLKGNCAKK